MKRAIMKFLGLWAIVLCFVLCFAVCFAVVSAAGEIVTQSPTLQKIMAQKVIRVGVNPKFKPFSFKKGEQREGVDIDIAKLLAKKLGARAEIVVPHTFSDLIPMLRGNEIDIIMAGMSITFERQKVIDFTNAYFDTGLSILLNKITTTRLGISAATSYRALHDELARSGKWKNLIVAVTKGKAPERIVPRFFPGARIKAFPTNEAAAEAVLKGEADIMVHDEMFLKVWLKENAKRASFRVVVLDPPFKPDYYGFAIRKGNQDFLNLLNVFVLELRANGYVDQFIGAYLPVKSRVTIRSFNITEDYYGGD